MRIDEPRKAIPCAGCKRTTEKKFVSSTAVYCGACVMKMAIEADERARRRSSR